MAVLNIPESDRGGLMMLRDLTDEAFGKLLADISQNPGRVPSIGGLTHVGAEAVMDAVNSLYRVREYNEVATDEFLSDVLESLVEFKMLEPHQSSGYRERLTKILAIDALKVAAKAVSLSTEHEHGYCTARIFSDVRPVFGKNPKEAPTGMIITHTLKLSYHDGARGGRLSDFYIAMGSHDLAELSDALVRAHEKSRSLQSALGPSGIKIFDPQQ